MLLSEIKLFEKFYISIPETLVYVLIGILGVFLVLAVLIGLLYAVQLLFKYDVFDKIGNIFKKKEKPAESKPESGEKIASTASAEDPDEIVAAITAAICAVYESESGEVPPFVIRNIKRK